MVMNLLRTSSIFQVYQYYLQVVLYIKFEQLSWISFATLFKIQEVPNMILIG
jgi:hypothetical protein